MPSRYSSDGSDTSTLYDEKASREEVGIVSEFIQNLPKKWKPSSDQIVIGVVHRENRRLLSDELGKKYSVFSRLFRLAKALARSFDNLDDAIYDAAESGSKKSLVLLVTPLASEIKFDVPSSYKSLTIIRCPDGQSNNPYLAIDPASRYCKIPIPQWDMRERHLKNKLRLESGVCLINRFGDSMISRSLYSSTFAASIRSQEDLLQDESTSWERRKGLVAGILGSLVAGGTTAFKLYSCASITSSGVFLKCESIKWGIAGVKALEINGITFAAGSMKASVVAAAQVVGPPLLIGAAAGAAVGALVYYVPWGSVFSWLKNLWNGFWNWLVEMFQAFRETVSSWFKEPERRSRSRGRSRSSHHHSTRMRVH